MICSLALLLLAVACGGSDSAEPPGAEVIAVVATATAIPTAEATAAPAPEPTAANTPTPEPTHTPEPTPTHTATPEPTFTPTPEPTSTPEPTPTPTATPEPTATPTPTPIPIGHSQASPAPAGSTVVTGDGAALTILSVNLNATDVVLNENSFNDPPDAGNRFVIARIRAQNVGDDPNKEISVRDSYFDIVASGSKFDDGCGAIPDELSVKLFAGGIGEGNVCFEIPESATDLALIHEPLLDWSNRNRRWLTLANPDNVEVPRVVAVSLTPSPEQSPGYFRTNPIPPGMTVETDDGLTFTIVSVNPDATDDVVNADPMYNSPPSEGNRYVMARVRVQDIGGEVNRETDIEGDSDFALVGSSAVKFSWPKYTCGIIADELNVGLFLGGVAEGNVCFEIPESETDLILFYDRESVSDRRWMTLANPDGVEAARDVEAPLDPSPGQTIGHFRTNPVPPGTWVETDDGLRLTAISVNPDATDVVMSEGSWVDPPAEGNRFFIVRVRVENVGGEADRETDIAYHEFKLVGSSSVQFRGTACDEIPDELRAELFPGGVSEGNTCFEIPQSETDLILFHDPIFGGRRWMRLPN